jgi:hypothetical protein
MLPVEGTAGPAETEARFPALSRADDLAHPLNRLYGISNYCSSLMNCYAESARRWWQEQDETGDAYRLKANGVEGADDVRKHHVRVMAMHEKTCEEWYQQLNDLSEAVRLAMPDVLLACKFLPPSERYHRNRKADWNAFGLEMKRVWIEAKRLTDAAVTGPAPADAASGKPDPVAAGPSHSADFTTVNWFGTKYTFDDGLQAKAVGQLWAEYEKGGLGLSEKTIGEKIGSNAENYRLANTFRGHPAWETMIVKVRQGVYRLKKPE